MNGRGAISTSEQLIEVVIPDRVCMPVVSHLDANAFIGRGGKSWPDEDVPLGDVLQLRSGALPGRQGPEKHNLQFRALLGHGNNGQQCNVARVVDDDTILIPDNMIRKVQRQLSSDFAVTSAW